MRFRLYREYGALNSREVFDAVEQGLRQLGHEIVTSNEDVSVIWSVLWFGRMQPNKRIYQLAKSQEKSVMIIEVGNLHRNKTWRLSLNHINYLGEFANRGDLDTDRPKKLKVKLEDLKSKRKSEILIATQHHMSLQWEGMPSMVDWVTQTVERIKQHTDRKIVIRPHPRSMFSINLPDVSVLTPKQIPGSYDSFDIDYNYHCVVNHNSGPAVQAAIYGVPVICDSTSLASSLSGSVENIENITLPDREDWFLKLCHTEWTTEEIAKGIPLHRLIEKIN